MPNGGPRPDCAHCKQFRGRPYNDNAPFCTFHDMPFASPIYAFCSHHVDPEPDGMDWLDKELDRKHLQPDLMYVWIGGYERKFVPFVLAPINEYRTWSEERFFEEFANLAEKYRNMYPPHHSSYMPSSEP